MYKHPGVYVEHVPSGLLAIEAASTSTAAFVGHVRRGTPVTAVQETKPVFITGPDMFTRLFGTLDGKAGGIRDFGNTPDYFGHAVGAFFANGGTKAYIVPVAKTGTGAAAKTSLRDPQDAANAFYFEAASPGDWPNDLFVGLEKTLNGDDPMKDEYTVVIGYKPDPKKPIEAIERLVGLVLDPHSGRYLVDGVNGGSTLLKVKRDVVAGGGGQFVATVGPPVTLSPTSLTAGAVLTVAVNGTDVPVTFAGGETSLATVAEKIQAAVRNTPAVQGGASFTATVSADGGLILVSSAGADPSTATVPGGGVAAVLGLDATAIRSTPVANAIVVALPGKTLDVKVGAGAAKTVTFDAAVADLAAAATQIEGKYNGAGQNPPIVVTADGDRLLLRVQGGSAAQAITVTGGDAGLGFPADAAAAAARPVTVDYPQAFDAVGGKAEARVVGGADTAVPGETEYKSAFDRLRDDRDVSILLLPGQFWKKGEGNAVIEAAITHAEFMKNRMVIVDSQETDNAGLLVSPNDVKALGAPTSPYAALYYPWLKVANPHYDKDTAANKPITFNLPPSSFAAGLWARIDGSRGVWKAPAGLEATVRGSQGPHVVISNDIQDNLNDLGVNCIRAIIGPPVIWGARTLATRTKPEFRYVSIRRTQNMIGESLYNALQAVVFEPNDHRLWASLRGAAGDFMGGLFRAGAFQGEKASDAYFVRCGLNSTMEQADIDAGIVRLVVGYAPLKPAEFVVVQIQQIVGQRG